MTRIVKCNESFQLFHFQHHLEPNVQAFKQVFSRKICVLRYCCFPLWHTDIRRLLVFIFRSMFYFGRINDWTNCFKSAFWLKLGISYHCSSFLKPSIQFHLKWHDGKFCQPFHWKKKNPHFYYAVLLNLSFYMELDT